jgi:hypothetical protein
MVADTEMLIEHCFSIIYRGSKTLDFVIPMEDRGTILDALDSVILGYQEAKVAVAKDVLLLRYVWLDVDMVRFAGSILISFIHFLSPIAIN